MLKYLNGIKMELNKTFGNNNGDGEKKDEACRTPKLSFE